MINQLVNHVAFCGYVCPWFDGMKQSECYASCVIYVVVCGLKYFIESLLYKK